MSPLGHILSWYDIRELSARSHEMASEEEREALIDALEHCGYDKRDCIDCGGPPHNEWCRFWKLRDVVPLLFSETPAK